MNMIEFTAGRLAQVVTNWQGGCGDFSHFFLLNFLDLKEGHSQKVRGCPESSVQQTHYALKTNRMSHMGMYL